MGMATNVQFQCRFCCITLLTVILHVYDYADTAYVTILLMYSECNTLYLYTLCMIDPLEVALCAITSKVRWDNKARKKKEVAERGEKGEEA